MYNSSAVKDDLPSQQVLNGINKTSRFDYNSNRELAHIFTSMINYAAQSGIDDTYSGRAIERDSLLQAKYYRCFSPIFGTLRSTSYIINIREAG